ncbi:hypothetical protein PRZ48_000028 [Zasmidium cellare]|uniref:Zn(2)-C6 fungal-type domain-containing protein n=1 Tax=Zasmidium cellare TaxID=395010 RepID=A0ABR0EYL6_ZASCE|nr:hypothetical protein PRZ48_000028 [Zasmidium cellare]
MPPERNERRRQNQVACHMCRARKLKCDHQDPCSSCSSRGWTCEYAGRQDAVSCQMCRNKKIKCDRGQPCSSCHLRQWKCDYSTQPLLLEPRQHGTAGQRASNASNTQSRLAKLEQAVFGDKRDETPSSQPVVKSQTSPMPDWSQSDERANVASDRWLENICDGLADIDPQDNAEWSVEIKTPIQLSWEYHQPKQAKRILLPPREFALRALHLYEESLESAQQVMHIPTVRAKVQLLYQQKGDVGAGSQDGLVALLLAMSAHIGFWDTYQRNGLFHDVELAAKVSTVLAHQAMDAMNYARHSTRATMEAVQAATLLVFLQYHMEGFSMRVRMLQSTALAMARELNLHMVDAVQMNSTALDQAAIIHLETGRKLWWYIACTDWLLAFDSGPTEGVYSVIPQQMRVKKPRNLSADDLSYQTSDFERTQDEATTMAYYFLRIELAEVCREAVDSMVMLQPEAVPYDKIYDLDAKFCALTTSLPRFLQLDIAAETIKQEIGDRYGSQIGLQRALANLMISVRRCKFHLPFLIRHNMNPRYAFSRYACLESAQRLLQVRRVFLDESSWQISSTLPLLGLYRFVFYAAMVLVMDLCLNNPNDRARLLEVRDAMQMVAETESTSRNASKFLQALQEVLLKHGISLPNNSESSLQPDQACENYGSSQSIYEPRPMTSKSNEPMFDFSEFEMLWPGNLTDDMFLDPHCWDGLINLDTRLV